MSNKRQEIGSEFWHESQFQPISERDGVYALSGRTAIDLIIQDIFESRKALRNVYMPAWCCESMILPFIDRGIKVDLYDITFDGKLNYLVDENKKTDVFYVNNYFGYENTIDQSIINQFKAQGTVILYDRTHSFLMDNDIEADYSFASIRKWMGVVCGTVVEGIKNPALKQCPYLALKTTAMQIKQAYMSGDDSIDKHSFLHLYGLFGHHLVEDYRNYAMDDFSYALYKSTDLAAMKAQRRANAQYLHHQLDLPSLSFLSDLSDKACPLFVPVLFSTKEERDRIRKKLIGSEIFCPIHWPKNQLITPELKVNQIFDAELSLICDQRYGIPEMQRITDTIQE